MLELKKQRGVMHKNCILKLFPVLFKLILLFPTSMCIIMQDSILCWLAPIEFFLLLTKSFWNLSSMCWLLYDYHEFLVPPLPWIWTLLVLRSPQSPGSLYQVCWSLSNWKLSHSYLILTFVVYNNESCTL
jgi:hypothetical protein